MGRKSSVINISDLRKAYKEIGSIKKLATMFKTSNNRIIKLLDENNIKKKNIGNKLELANKIVNGIVKDYEENGLIIRELCDKYNLKTDAVRKILRENNVEISKWHCHKKEDKITNLGFIKLLKEFAIDNNIEYEEKFKAAPQTNVSIRLNDVCVDLYLNKRLLDYNGYDNRVVLKNKKDKINKAGYKLIQIFEDEIKLRRNVVFSKIVHLLKKDDIVRKIPGRCCFVEEIDKKKAEEFLEQNHIQGFVGSTVYIGAFYEKKLVAVMSFLNEGNDNWNLTRFASLNGYICQGVGGKLFKHFIVNYNPILIRSFADRRWTLNVENNIYTKLGFRYEYSTNPGYMYCSENNYKRVRREQFKKSNLIKKYNFTNEITDVEMAKKIGYYRIWDCGLYKYVWRNSDNEIKTETVITY